MFGILLAGVGDHLGTLLRKAVAKIETLFLVSLNNEVIRLSMIFDNVDKGRELLVMACHFNSIHGA